MHIRILLTRKWPEQVERYLASRYDTTLNTTDKPMSASDLQNAMRTYDVVCPTISDKIDRNIIEVEGRIVRLICNYGTGYDHIDTATCEARGIIVTNTPDVLTEATAELAILLMLMVARRAGEGERELRSGKWLGWRPMHLHGTQVSGKTLGLVGFGRIAQATAEKAVRGLQMSIIYHSRKRAEPHVEQRFAASYRSRLEDLLSESDFVSLHCPGGPETAKLINAPRLLSMKPSAFLINTARGSVIDERALATALAGGYIAGAALDVFKNEPDVSEELLNAPNTVLLPHLGSATSETRITMGMRAIGNLEAWLDHGLPPDRVI